MPRVVVDATGMTFRPSGARTRLISLLAAYVALPDALDITVLASSGRHAREQLAETGVAVRELEPTIPLRVQRVFSQVGLTDEEADLVQLETLPIPLRPSAPTLLTIHDLRASEELALASSLGKAIYERHVLPRVAPRVLSGIIAVSNATAEDVRSRTRLEPDLVHVVPNAVAPPRVDPGRDPLGRPYVLAFGHIERRKNLSTILPAMQLAVETEQVPRLLVIAGRDLGAADEIRSAHRDLGANRFELRVLTEVDDSTREALLANAACLVAPSLVEGFGLVPLEAVIRGTPAVVADIQVTREALGGAAFYVDPNDPVSFAQGIVGAIRSPDRQVAAAMGTVQRRSWRRSAELLHEVWTMTLDAR